MAVSEWLGTRWASVVRVLLVATLSVVVACTGGVEPPPPVAATAAPPSTTAEPTSEHAPTSTLDDAWRSATMTARPQRRRRPRRLQPRPGHHRRQPHRPRRRSRLRRPAATATPSPVPGRCTISTDPTCVVAVYLGTPTDYAQVSDVPEDKLLTPGADGRYHVHGGQQITVVTAAPLPSGWTRFYPGGPDGLARSRSQAPGSPPGRYVASRPATVARARSVSALNDAPTRFIFELVAANPDPERPNRKLLFGDVVVKTQFQTPRISYSAFDTTGAATTARQLLVPHARHRLGGGGCDDSGGDVRGDAQGGDDAGRERDGRRRLRPVRGPRHRAGGRCAPVGPGIARCWTRYKVTSAPEPAEGSSVRSSA